MSLFHKCGICGIRMFTPAALLFHIAYHHRATPVPPRFCLICQEATKGADAFCSDCQRMSEDEQQQAVKHLVELAEISDWDTHEASHPEHMMDKDEPPRKHWYATLVALVAHHGFMLDDSGRE
ncbi:MAG: hypothetical protein ACXWP0_01290 [Ktedonobacterales bacterium]